MFSQNFVLKYNTYSTLLGFNEGWTRGLYIGALKKIRKKELQTIRRNFFFISFRHLYNTAYKIKLTYFPLFTEMHASNRIWYEYRLLIVNSITQKIQIHYNERKKML